MPFLTVFLLFVFVPFLTEFFPEIFIFNGYFKKWNGHQNSECMTY